MATNKKVFRKPNLVPATAITADFQSPPSDLREIDRICYVIVFTGTLTGQPTIQTSLDYDPANSTNFPGIWDDMNIPLAPLTTGGQRYVVDITETGVPFTRVNFDFVSGTGTIQVHVSGKES